MKKARTAKDEAGNLQNGDQEEALEAWDGIYKDRLYSRNTGKSLKGFSQRGTRSHLFL